MFLSHFLKIRKSRIKKKNCEKAKEKNQAQLSLWLSPILSTCRPHAVGIPNSLVENYRQEISLGSDKQIDSIQNNLDQDQNNE